MADKDPAPTPEPNDDGGGLTMKDLRELIKSVITENKPADPPAGTGPQPQTHNQQATDIESQVNAALAKIGKQQELDKAAQEDKDWKAKVDAAISEKQPIKRRRIHEVMGWGE